MITVRINGETYTEIVRARISRDLKEIAGTFDITIVDQARLNRATVAAIGVPTSNAPIKVGDAITILIDDEPVLVGWIEKPRFRWVADNIGCQIFGRDKTGDLVEGAVPPELPTQFRGVDLLNVATAVCKRYGIPVKKDVDIGAPFDNLCRYKHQTALAFLEGAARQRATLLTSDGIGGLMLTRGGSSRAPEPLYVGGNVHELEVEDDWSHRFSDYYVMQDTGLANTAAPGLLLSSVPDDDEPDDAPDATTPPPGTGTGAMGHATDPEITRYRPTVRLTRSQSGMSTLQEQAEWMCRVARGNSMPARITVLGHRAGSQQQLWRPNQVTALWDPYSGKDRDMLIAGLEFLKSEEGSLTRLRLVGPSAYDRINEAERHRRRRVAAAAPQNLITTVPDQ